MPSRLNDLPGCSSFSRRSFLRSASAAAIAGPILTEAHFARAAALAAGAVPEFSMTGVYIDANENPLGPSEAARKAIADIIPNGGRYAPPLYFNLMKTFAEQMGVPADHRHGLRRIQSAAPLCSAGFHLAVEELRLRQSDI